MSYKYTASGGSEIQVLLEFPDMLGEGRPAVLHMASAISVSYSVYRAKTNVYNLGQPILGGLAIGKKYVAGSLITVAYQIDEISKFINTQLEVAGTSYSFTDPVAGTDNLGSTTVIGRQDRQYGFIEVETSRGNQSFKDVRNIMRDDLLSCNIHFILSSEYPDAMGPDNPGVVGASKIIVYGAQFINNGQVMSINDIITENTLSFIARDVKEQHTFNSEIESFPNQRTLVTASSLLNE